MTKKKICMYCSKSVLHTDREGVCEICHKTNDEEIDEERMECTYCGCAIDEDNCYSTDDGDACENCVSYCNSCDTYHHTDDVNYCDSCDTSSCGEHYSCDKCGIGLCEDCIQSCSSCGETLCDCCIKKCSECDDTYCEGCLEKCKKCDNLICGECSKEHECEVKTDGNKSSGTSETTSKTKTK